MDYPWDCGTARTSTTLRYARASKDAWFWCRRFERASSTFLLLTDHNFGCDTRRPSKPKAHLQHGTDLLTNIRLPYALEKDHVNQFGVSGVSECLLPELG